MENLKPQYIIILSFVVTIFIGTCCLCLPYAVHGARLSVVDAFFTATSATCVTGLIVVDTGSKFTFFGQLVILLLIQTGGLGFMTISTFFIVLLGKRLTIKSRMILQESIIQYPFKDFKGILVNLIGLVFLFESIGAALLYTRFDTAGYAHPLWLAVFHSVSAFCNAGFALFADSLNQFSADPLVNFTVITLIISGGLGFLVLIELKDILLRWKWKSNRSNLSFHSKVVIVTSIVLVGAAFVLLFGFEFNTSLVGRSFTEKFFISLFQAVTPRTAGFNSITTADMSIAGICLLMVLMFIGGSSGSTAGGVKTGTVFVLYTYIISLIKGEDKVFVFKRTIPSGLIKRCVTIFFLAFAIVVGVTILLSYTEQPGQVFSTGRKVFLPILFETVSAFGTVGLSLGLTPHLSETGRIIISVLMFIGRLGPLLLAISLFEQKDAAKFEYPEENILIG